ncbi:MAG: DnaA regulatory inactivator Hda, partial [Methylococcaceae bacterium]|nr:DnaA regulatory inactivator Hda [Methylococcaceae bacterium]
IFKADQLGFEISPKVGRFLLTHYARDLNGLWVLLEKLDRASLAAKRKLTLPFLRQVLSQIISD